MNKHSISLSYLHLQFWIALNMAGEEDINSEHDKLPSDSFFSNNIIAEINQPSLIELLIERVEILEKDVVNLKKEVADLKTEKLQVKKFSLTPADKIVTISDDDDDMDKRITTSSRSPYQRSDKGKSVMIEGNELPKPGKRLFGTPPSTQKPIKKGRGSTSISPTVKRYCKKIMNQASKPKGHTIPKEVKSCFKPSPIMDLTWEESRISAYIFNEQLDLDGDLFMIGDETGSRREFLSLATGRDINDKIYVPMVEDNVHWYLMVVDIDDYAIYKLDTWDMKTFRQRRHSDMLKMASIFDRVLNQPHYEMKMKYFPKNLSSWEIKNGEGIPNLWNSRNSATWVIQWLEMEDSFMSTVIGELHDETVRMKTAMKLVMHDMNKMKKEVKTQSTLMWSKLPFI
ncbi:hypothetical protein Lal_00032179 [Lupinus albus]|nr:hypothetical protein Lal_00032179 [Lupinus albus]